jgi:hypothetical protein
LLTEHYSSSLTSIIQRLLAFEPVQSDGIAPIKTLIFHVLTNLISAHLRMHVPYSRKIGDCSESISCRYHLEFRRLLLLH